MSLRLQGRWSGREDKFPLQCSTSVGSRLWFSAVAAWDFAVFVFHFGDSFCPAVYFDFFHDKVFDRFVCFPHFTGFSCWFIKLWINGICFILSIRVRMSVNFALAYSRAGLWLILWRPFSLKFVQISGLWGKARRNLTKRKPRSWRNKSSGIQDIRVHLLRSVRELFRHFCCLFAIDTGDIQKIPKSTRLTCDSYVLERRHYSASPPLAPFRRDFLIGKIWRWNFCLPPRSFSFCVATLVCSLQTRSMTAESFWLPSGRHQRNQRRNYVCTNTKTVVCWLQTLTWWFFCPNHPPLCFQLYGRTLDLVSRFLVQRLASFTDKLCGADRPWTGLNQFTLDTPSAERMGKRRRNVGPLARCAPSGNIDPLSPTERVAPNTHTPHYNILGGDSTLRQIRK